MNKGPSGGLPGMAEAQVADPGRTIVVALVGQPNVGKSTVFNLLTGLSQHVGNWPGKTVERREGTLLRDGVRMRVVDLPGIYSLTANSEEERIARDFILMERPDVVIMVADASALERNLYLLSELLVLPVPIVLGLNMMDMAEAQHLHVEPQVLEAALRLPVIPLVATRNQGTSALIDTAERLARDPGTFDPARPEVAEPHREVLSRVKSLLQEHVPVPYPGNWIALKLLEGDREIIEKAQNWLPDKAWGEVALLLAEHEDAVLDIAGGRYEWIGRMVRAAITHPRLGQVGITDRLDKVVVHPLWGPFLLLAAFGLVFWLTFTVASPIQEWLEVAIVAWLQNWLTTALQGISPWWIGLLTKGVLGGVGLVLTFLPVLLIFFTALALLEDSGYLARVAYVMDRFMHLLGLHGKSALPMLLGFGCNVPAVMGARVIESPSGRLLTILLAPLVPCSARLAVLAFLAPLFFGKQALLVSWSLVALNMVVLAIVGVLLSRTVFRGEHGAFIMELPLYHAPNARSIAMFVWSNTWAFLRKAGTLILLASIAVWTLSNFPGHDVEHSYLAYLGRSLAPLGELMGMDWRMIVALLSSFIAKENAIATLGILYGAGSEAAGLSTTLAQAVPPAAALSFLTVTMLFVPCAATIAVMRAETGSWRWTLFGVTLLLVIALVAGVGAYHAAPWFGIRAIHA